MQTLNAPLKIAVVQAAPVWMDRDATLDKACELILEAGQSGARLVAFPESFIPGYPDWVWSVPAGEVSVLNELNTEFFANALTIPSDALDKVCRIARRARTHVVLGVSERSIEGIGPKLYDTLVYIDAQGRLLGRHRKLVPTGGERLVWAQGDGSALSGFSTPLGKMGGLLGLENYMPLARYALYTGGVQIYLAATWAHAEPWLATLRHIAKEGRVYVLSACSVLRHVEPRARNNVEPTIDGNGEWPSAGDSAIVNPAGDFIAGPVRAKEEILYAEIDPKQLRGPQWMLDVAGHDARPDVFQFTINRRSSEPIMEDDGVGHIQAKDAPEDWAHGI